MLLEQHLLQLFGNLPYLPKTEIAKHLKQIDLIKAYLVSENWDKAIECRKIDVGRKRKKISNLYMSSKTDRVEMQLYEYGSGGLKHLIIDFPMESALENSTEIAENGVRVICRSENFNDLANKILTISHKIRLWFEADTRVIGVNLDFGFNLKFFEKLGHEKLDIFELSGYKNDGKIDGKELCDLLNTWEIDSICINIETIGKFEGNPEMLRGLDCVFTDSRWITGDMFFNKPGSGTLKRCLLTSEDFNRFFKKWIDKKEISVENLECHMEHELDVRKVLEGLETKKWDQKERGRMYRLKRNFRRFVVDLNFSRKPGYYPLIDLAEEMDLYRSNGEIGTVRISADKKVIRFFSWSDKFPLETDKKHFTTMIDQLKPKLEQFVWSPRELAKIAKKVEDYEAKLQAVEEEIARENQ